MLKTNEMMGACVARRRAWSCGALAVALAGSLALAGCTGGTFEEAAEGAGEKTEQGQSDQAQGDNGTTGTTGEVDWASLIDIPGMDFAYSDRDKDASYDVASATNIALSGQGATVSGEGAAVEGATVTISAAGTYAVTGELTAGSLVVNAGDQDKVQIVLSGASIRNEAGPALNIQQADKVFVTLADGTQNTLADGASYELVEGEDEPNAALYSKADLTINGTGALSVEGNYRHGVNSKDDLVVTGGAITVVAKEDGLRGKDCVKVADGSFAITAGGDGVKSSNDEDPTRGFVSIDGGTFTVTGCEEGIEAQEVIVNNGELNITASDDGINAAVAERDSNDATIDASGDAGSTVGQDDHAGDQGGEGQGDGGQGADAQNGRGGQRPELPEGVEPGQMPDGEQGGGFGARDGRGGAGGPMGANASEDCLIQINGGVVAINAGGDAVDSNGYVEVTGGELVGASSGAGDSALDYEYGATVTGGTVILAGGAGMAETFSEGSTQPFALVSLNGSANTELSVESESGEVLARCTVPVSFQCVTLSVPGLAEGATGKLVAGDATTDFTASTTSSGGMGAMGAPGGMEAPRDRGDRGGRDAQASTPEATA
ncbi:MAG: carbohydrate-binding domain-containing protein [Adlercreutzia equolifaciens]